MKAVAKKVIRDQAEDKYITRFAQTSGLPRYFNGMITASDIYYLLPPIIQGTASNQRIGNKIRPTRLRVDFVLTVNGAFDANLLLHTRLMVLRDKTINSTLELIPLPGTQPGTPVATELLDIGGGTSGFNGEPGLIMARINKERYTVIRDVQKEVCSGSGLTPQASNSFAGTQTFVSGAQAHRFSVVIPTPKTFNYSLETDQYPTNFAPFFVLGYAQPDGNALNTNLLSRIALNYLVHLDYEDA